MPPTVLPPPTTHMPGHPFQLPDPAILAEGTPNYDLWEVNDADAELLADLTESTTLLSELGDAHLPAANGVRVPEVDPSPLWDAAPGNNSGRQHSMIGRMYQILLDWHFQPKLNTTATPHQVAQPDLCETLQVANRIFNRRRANDDIFINMACPLLALPIFSIQEIMQPDDMRIMTADMLRAKFGERAGAAQCAALDQITSLLCDGHGQRRLPHHNIIPAELRPQSRSAWAADLRERTMRPLRCSTTRHNPATGIYEGLIDWWVSSGITLLTIHLLAELGYRPSDRTPAGIDEAGEPTFDVSWVPTWETNQSLLEGVPQSVLQSQQEWDPDLHAASARQGHRAATARARMEQPIDTRSCLQPLPLPTTACLISQTEVNPDVDIQPSDSCRINIHSGKAWCYIRSGFCVGAIPAPLLLSLQASLPPTQCLPSLQAAITHLVHLYHKRYSSTSPRSLSAAELQSPLSTIRLNADLLACLCQTFSISTQWRTNALIKCPGIARFTTAAPANAPFGAVISDSPHRFTGTAGLLLPTLTDEDIVPSLKWAILSTYAAEPTLTVIITPALTDLAAYRRYRNHGRVHKLCTITKDKASISTLMAAGDYRSSPCKTDIDILVVANAAGVSEFWKFQHASSLQTCLEAAHDLEAAVYTDLWPWHQTLAQSPLSPQDLCFPK